MRKPIILTLFALGFILSQSLTLMAQDTDSTLLNNPVDTMPQPEKLAKPIKEKAPKLSDSTLAANGFLKTANRIFDADVKRYDEAAKAYSDAFSMGVNDAQGLYRAGISYYLIKDYKNSALNFLRLIEKDSSSFPKAYYYLGRLNHLNYNFDTAITYYEEYRRLLSPEELHLADKEIAKLISESQTATDLVAKPVGAFIDKMDQAINSQFVDYAPIIDANNHYMVFTRQSLNNIGGNRDQAGNYFEDIYFSTKDSNDVWAEAQNIGKSINTADHDAAAGLSFDGNQLLVYRSSGNGDLFLSKRVENQWSKPKKLKGNINSSAHESSASFSYDNLVLYFSSDRAGGYGGQDIYTSRIDEKGNWSLAENLKGKINTEYNEVTFSASPDGKTFYFSSNGHNTMGGYDVFKITYSDSAWSEPQNMGYPINTPNDDILVSLSADGKVGYIASSKGIGSLHDIYMITMSVEAKGIRDDIDVTALSIYKRGAKIPANEAAKNIQQLALTVLKGNITDEYSKEPIFANIELTDNATNQVVATFNSNEKSGQYLASLPSGKDYGIAVKAENCLFYSDNITIPKDQGYKELVKDIQLKRIEVGSKVVLKNIFFETGKSALSKSSETELQNLLKLMNDIPTLKIEISGHTDNVGNAAKNKVLSEQRAKAVVDYLIAKGISTDRLLFKGYGFEQPIASNKTPDGRQQNRRTEFKVIAR